MYIITIDPEKCKGDGQCGETCPVSILGVAEVNGKKIAVVQGDLNECLGCESCTTICENNAITVTEV